MANRHEPRHKVSRRRGIDIYGRPVPGWLAREGTTGRVLRMPDRDDTDVRLDPGQIIGFYTR